MSRSTPELLSAPSMVDRAPGHDLDNTAEDAVSRAPLVLGGLDLGSLTDQVCSIAERRRPPRAWTIVFAVAVAGTVMLGLCIAYLVTTGVGVWGNNQPVSWGFAITNFVFWVGIGHAGTLISAVLFLFRQNWRTGINRFAEAMTIFAVVCAGLFPAIHVGRPWLAYWLLPYPNQMGTVPQFRSPLLWDAFAVGTYATVSLLFWYIGMIPDLASLRDRATTRGRFYFYGLLSLGWRSSHRHWHRYERAYLLLAALATPLVLSVHSVVSFDFATAQLPGWHSTILPPYFVAGAIFSGFAMVVTLALAARQIYGLQNLITARHLDNMARIILATGLMMTYAYAVELFGGLHAASGYERFTALNHLMGDYAWAWWTMIGCNVVIPQLLWSKRCRQNAWVLLAVAVAVNVGMWMERFVICMTLSRDFLPSSWHTFRPTIVDVLTLIGSFGLFFTLFLLFLRFLPIVAIAEVKTVLAHERNGEPASADRLPLEAASPGDRFAEAGPACHALLAEYATAEALLAAAGRVRDAGLRRWDAFAPYPVHGLDQAMGLRKSRLPWLVLIGGLTGMAVGTLLCWWTNATRFDVPSAIRGYPLLISGKPIFSFPANIPVIFELTILFSAFAAVFGMLGLNRLPQLYHPLFRSDRFLRATRDRFFIAVEATDPSFDPARVAETLQNDALAIERIRS